MAKKRANSGPGRYSDKVLPRKSSPAGMSVRLRIRQNHCPGDSMGYHYNKPGSLNPRKCGS